MRKIHKQGNEPNALEQRRLGDVPFGWGEIDDDSDLKDEIKNAQVIPDQAIWDRQSGISSKLTANPETIPHLGIWESWESGIPLCGMTCRKGEFGEAGERVR